jgi:Holliday junction resolvasome RuvABC endonuclease subunit
MSIDPSLTGTGIVVIDSKRALHLQTVITKPGNSLMDRIGSIACQVFLAQEKYEPDLIVIEGLSMGSFGGMIHDRTGLHYILRWQLWRGVGKEEVLIVPPATLKKFVAGKGNATKEFMLLHAFKRWGMEFPDNNQCDAYCLAQFGLAYLTGGLPAGMKTRLKAA